MTTVKREQAEGLAAMPRTETELRGVLAAKQMVESLNCFMEVRELLCRGKSRREIADFIQSRRRECVDRPASSVRQYVGLYKKFVMRQTDFVNASAAPSKLPEPNYEKGTAVSIVPEFQLPDALEIPETSHSNELPEIEGLRRLAHLQEERIKRFVNTETGLMQGFPLATIRAEIQLLKEIHESIRFIKSDLASFQETGYRKTPQKIDARVTSVPPLDVSTWTDEERAYLRKFIAPLNTTLRLVSPPKDKTPEAMPVGA